jgi:hypothetical protein
MSVLSPARSVDVRLSGLWVRLSIALALVAAVANIVGLLAPGTIYGQETEVLADQAAAQDVVGLVLVAPLIAGLAISAARGAIPAYLCWLGCLAFTAYNYAIYAFSIHFGPLFLPWVAVLGSSVYAFVGGLATIDATTVKLWFAGRALRLTSWALIVLATVFALLWLSEIVPDLLAGRGSTSAGDYQVPTNPVHVLDLAIFIPAVAVSGVLLLRKRPLGYATAPGMLVFLALTCVPITLTPLIADLRGHDAEWAVVPPIALLLAAIVGVMWRTLRNPTITPRSDAAVIA